jgi:hypothetical protein
LEAIAEALGISKGEVSRKVSGKAGWSLDQICKLFEVLGIEAKARGTKSESEDYVKALETVLRHKLSEGE